MAAILSRVISVHTTWLGFVEINPDIALPESYSRHARFLFVGHTCSFQVSYGLEVPFVEIHVLVSSATVKLLFRKFVCYYNST